MFFTHTPANLERRAPGATAPHPWTDIILGNISPEHAFRVRCRYRQLRKLGLTPYQVRSVIWDLMVAVGSSDFRFADHDLWRENP